ncbi:Snmp1 [Drosophila busckii]|uniref:Sensory neuron membrane protein 1 n=1 Tax=Drosophila busckii TaxID=30019 RepID=A0A0M4E9I5_DROBS|nr:Snmp1 [Drosophila busckii]
MVKKSVTLKPGSETRQIWEKLPFPMTFKVYVFNVTNVQEIQNGGKPALQEVGPFVFEEWKDKYNVQDIEDENAVSFNMRNTFKLRIDLGLSGKEIITLPQPLLQFMAIATLGQSAEVHAAVALGLNALFKPQTAFITSTFMELFYEGFDINCAQVEPAAEAICQQLQAGAVAGAVPVNATHYKFSLLGASNHSNAGHFKVQRSKPVGRVLQFNGLQQLHNWPEVNASCNSLRGTDGTIFAPLMRPQQGLWSYSAQLCRSLSPKWMGKTKYAELPAQRYELDLDASELSCFCTTYPTDCPAQGTMDLLRCSGAPLIASLPHFYQADQQLLQQVSGLAPTASKHASVIIFEQYSGTVLSVYNRLQFSLKVAPVEQVPVMSKLRPLAMPIFWIEESLQLDESITKVLHKKIFAQVEQHSFYMHIFKLIFLVAC